MISDQSRRIPLEVSRGRSFSPVTSLLFAAATTDKSSRLFAEVLPWLLLLLGVIIVGGVIIFLARRYVHSSSAGQAGGFTLHDLRELHDAGELSDEEFERAKAQMIGRLKSPAPTIATAATRPESKTNGSSPPGNPPAV